MSDDESWGWIPSMSGEISSPDRVKDGIAGIDERYGFEYSYECDDTGRKITARSRSGPGRVEVTVHDDNGLCTLKIVEGTESNAYDIREKVWMELRKVFDSRSITITDCPAMNKPIVAKEDDVVGKMAEAFIDSMDDLSYSGMDALEAKSRPTQWGALMQWAIRMDVIADATHMYFGRFLDFYAGTEKKESFDLSKEMNARYRKTKTIHISTARIAEFRYKENSDKSSKESLDIARYALVIAAIAALISVIGVIV